MNFASRKERYEWLVKTHAAEKIAEFKAAFGDIKLTNVGEPPFPEKPEVKNIWEGMGIKTK